MRMPETQPRHFRVRGFPLDTRQLQIANINSYKWRHSWKIDQRDAHGRQRTFASSSPSPERKCPPQKLREVWKDLKEQRGKKQWVSECRWTRVSDEIWILNFQSRLQDFPQRHTRERHRNRHVRRRDGYHRLHGGRQRRKRRDLNAHGYCGSSNVNNTIGFQHSCHVAWRTRLGAGGHCTACTGPKGQSAFAKLNRYRGCAVQWLEWRGKAHMMPRCAPVLAQNPIRSGNRFADEIATDEFWLVE